MEVSKEAMGYLSKFCILTKFFLHHHTECNRCKHGMCWSLLLYGIHKDHLVYIKTMWCTWRPCGVHRLGVHKDLIEVADSIGWRIARRHVSVFPQSAHALHAMKPFSSMRASCMQTRARLKPSTTI